MFDKEYVFHGKHANMVKWLVGKLSDEIGCSLFDTNYDVYRVAPIIGWIYNRKAEVDKGEANTKIFRDKMGDESDDLKINFRTLMLLGNKDKTDKEKLEIAFKMDDKDEERKKYDELYNSYVLGGIEEIYDRLYPDDNDIDALIMNLNDFIMDLKVRLYGMDASEL